MAWTPHPTVITGQTWSASDQNTYVKGNLDTLFPYDSALQIAYSTSTTALTKATGSAALTVLRVNSGTTALEFGLPIVVYKRQGNSTAAWFSTSTSTAVSNYTPTNPIIQSGVFSLNSSAQTITFPTNFATAPLVFYGVEQPTSTYFVTLASVSTSGFTLNVSSTGTLTPCQWIALGEI